MSEAHAEDVPRPRALLSFALFLATVFTTTAHGAAEAHHGLSVFPLRDGLSYSLPLMAILVCHELGHYFAARIHRVPASLPFFVPLPPGVGLLGTMGAVILQSETSDRKKLIDIGAAGPLAGLAVALPVLWYGLAHSPVGPQMGLGSLQEGNSIIYALLKRAVKGQWLPGHGQDVFLHPTAMAGWAGLLVTMLNLLPVGQLDGGHVATAYFGDRYAKVAAVLHAALPVLAIGVFSTVYISSLRELVGAGVSHAWRAALLPAGFAATVWMVWFGALHLMKRMAGGMYHPPVEARPLVRERVALFWAVCVVFVLTFMPVPLRISIGSADVSGKAPASAAP